MIPNLYAWQRMVTKPNITNTHINAKTGLVNPMCGECHHPIITHNDKYGNCLLCGNNCLGIKFFPRQYP